MNAKLPLTISLVAVLSLTIFLPGVTADTRSKYAEPYIFIFEKSYSYYPLNTYTDQPVIYSDDGNVTLSVQVGMPRAESMFIFGGCITFLSYKASWENNKTVVLYNNGKYYDLNFYLRGIPYGSHQIEVYASGNISITEDGFKSAQVFSGNNTICQSFTVAPPPTPTPTPTETPKASPALNIEQILILIALMAALTASLAILLLTFYRRNQNPKKLVP
jgi:hypothetical protein